VIAGPAATTRSTGSAPNDVICGGDNNIVIGGAGDDPILGRAGTDLLDGGRGNGAIDDDPGDLDSTAFFDEVGPVTATLVTGTATGDGNDTFTNADTPGSA
jgi:Ca2+-binding RTX toxin-like protein